jgi:murein tripeptide amidase MpaA
MKLTAVLFMLVASALADGYKRYDNYKLLRVTPSDLLQVQALARMELRSVHKVDFWSRPSAAGRRATAMIAPQDWDIVLAEMAKAGVNVELLDDNVQRMIDAERVSMQNRRVFKAGDDPRAFDLTQYHQIAEINTWMDSLASMYPSVVSMSSIGKSKEGRDMRIMKIGHAGTNKNGFWIDAGIHAREWVAPATANYIINELVTKHNSTYKTLLDAIDFHVLPSMNPDGYEYTFTNDRLWRKTRGGPYCHNGIFGQTCCYGADANRNWPFHWGENGASNDPCSEVFMGPEAWSEVECNQTAMLMTSLKGSLKAMITLHSYSELILWPYGYAQNAEAPDAQDLSDLGNQMNTAITAVHNTQYTVENSAGLYPAAGASDDWSKSIGIKWVYTLELRPGPGDTDNDQGFGFELPASYIMRTADEAWAGILVAANRVMTGPN